MMIATLGVPASPAPATSPQPGAAALPFGLVLDAAMTAPMATPVPATPAAAPALPATVMIAKPHAAGMPADVEQGGVAVESPMPTPEFALAPEAASEAASVPHESTPRPAPSAPASPAAAKPATAAEPLLNAPIEPAPAEPVQAPVQAEAKMPMDSEAPAPVIAEEQASEPEGGDQIEQPVAEEPPVPMERPIPAQTANAPAPERASAPLLLAASESAPEEPAVQSPAEPLKVASAEAGRAEPMQARLAEPQSFAPAGAEPAQATPVREQPMPPATASAQVGSAELSADRALPETMAEPVIEAEPGRFGRELGIEIARRVAAGREEVTVRLNPQELGRIEVKMAFDEGGSLRAVVSAESPAALDMLRRDTGDLVRALGDAGVRSDSQSFRFDARGGDGGQQWARQHQQGGGEQRHGQQHQGRNAWADGEAQPAPANFRQLRASGRIDLMA